MTPNVDGSSLLTRGKPDRTHTHTSSERIIPAYAWKTDRTPPLEACHSAHPCLRGENPFPKKFQEYVPGSSLLTRGKLPVLAPLRPSQRLIPAYAGKTLCGCGVCCAAPAHPCLRGENFAPMTMASQAGGSSLLTRGKPEVSVSGAGLHGLIPAYAGKTPCTKLIHSPSYGSSLLTRGKQVRTGAKDTGDRLIPAYAGKTPPMWRRRSRSGAHPCLRGENYVSRVKVRSTRGSSLLTRGKPGTTAGDTFQTRLIPAYAGKT